MALFIERFGCQDGSCCSELRATFLTTNIVCIAAVESGLSLQVFNVSYVFFDSNELIDLIGCGPPVDGHVSASFL